MASGSETEKRRAEDGDIIMVCGRETEKAGGSKVKACGNDMERSGDGEKIFGYSKGR